MCGENHQSCIISLVSGVTAIRHVHHQCHTYTAGVEQTSAKLTGAATPGHHPHPPLITPLYQLRGQLTRIVRIKFFI